MSATTPRTFRPRSNKDNLKEQNKSKSVKSERQNRQNNIVDEARNMGEMALTLAEDFTKGRTYHGQTTYDGKGLSSKSPSNAPIIARAKFETVANTFNVTIANFSAILVGHSNIEQMSSSRDCERVGLQGENGSKEADSNDGSERLKGVTEKVECQRQLFNKGEVRSNSGPKEVDCTLKYQTAKGVVDCQLQPLSDTLEKEHRDSSGASTVRVEPPMALIKIQGNFSGKQREGEQLLKALELFQDNGMFDQHKRLATEKIHYYEDRKNADMVLVLKIEQAATLSYENKSKLAKKMLISITESDLNGQALHGNAISARAFFLLAAHMRREEKNRKLKLTELFEYLRRSEYLLQHYDSPVDWADLHYIYGCLWLDYLNLIPDSAAIRDNARCSFEKALFFSQKDHRLRVRIRRERYAHIKLASVLLDCCSTTARIQQKTIPPSDIKQAEDHLDIVQFKLGDSIPKITWIELLKTRSYQFYRRGSYNLAKERAEEAFRLALLHKFDILLNTLQEMIELFAMKLHSHLVFTEEVEFSSSEAAYSASGSDSG